MIKHLYAIWLGDVFFCFSGETSEPKVDAWTRVVKRLELRSGWRPFAGAALRLTEVKYPVAVPAEGRTTRRGLPGRTLEGLALAPKDAFELLLGWDEQLCRSQGLEPGGELRYWAAAARFALELMGTGGIVPGALPPRLLGSRRRGGEQAASAAWSPAFRKEADRELFLQMAASMPVLALGTHVAEESDLSSREDAGAYVLYSFLQAVMTAEVKRVVAANEGKLAPYKANYRRGYSPLTELWWNSLLTGSRDIPVQGTPAEVAELLAAVNATAGSDVPHAETEEARSGQLSLGLRLEPPADESEEWRLSFWVESREEGEFWLPAAAIWGSREREFTLWGKRYRNIQQQLLSALGRAAKLSPDIQRALAMPAPDGVELAAEQLYLFLKESVQPLRERGITVQMPSRWSREGRRRIGMKMKMQPPAGGIDGPAQAALGMEQLISFRIEASLGDSDISEDELSALVEAGVPYVRFRGEWIEIDPKEVRQVLRYMKRNESGEMSAAEWMRLEAEDGNERLWKGMSVTGMETSGLLASLMQGDMLRHLPMRPVPPDLHGTLRPYQERGFQWLASLSGLGFGVCLADDMGLGKTVQVITCLLDRALTAPPEEQREPVLILCPTSLLGNWQRELQRFAPSLRVHIHHGGRRVRGGGFAQLAASHEIVLTTYHLAGRDSEDLAGVRWSTVVLDEAQYIKNHRTKQAQSVMKLSAPHRIAMTGTPVENRLGELWSIFHFLNPGYLGTYHSFRQRYVSGEGGDRLRELHRLVSPFLLRRLKSDPDISKDLPEKLELKQYCALTETQAALYQGVVNEMLGVIGERSGMARRGLVLSSLTKLKQICDHPQLFRGDEGRGQRSEASGKMEVMFEVLDSIAELGESALIFTQYVAMGELLVSRLARRYGKAPLFLHGGVPKRERDEMVHAFQEGEGPAFFVLSLKAGGVGLNLTRANHVLHYDRWWNPAVENQATDRAFRIGQHKNVQVHKLICQGTLEERIDELIERKKNLSEQVVGSGENWLTEMSNHELKELIELQGQDWM
ncbi:DEAD/DEAH box helicase [Paenibacillus jilunlii]|uniref:Superfamily II DNA or RNA helicase, SNF2 family n=1 Tax=Paenibacillus jilunlii TaxID=682956 RepID=A0A1G9IF03_9BACL|nr:DEAD/DEAH box helicase [Paenibacillus jilunlii]SDL23820.1 Superfamily II DNA or RNA helicase, SNF2 family [Paenibacillus jilunlii]